MALPGNRFGSEPELADPSCATAQEGMDAAARATRPHSGKTVVAAGIGNGQKEHRVIL